MHGFLFRRKYNLRRCAETIGPSNSEEFKWRLAGPNFWTGTSGEKWPGFRRKTNSYEIPPQWPKFFSFSKFGWKPNDGACGVSSKRLLKLTKNPFLIKNLASPNTAHLWLETHWLCNIETQVPSKEHLPNYPKTRAAFISNFLSRFCHSSSLYFYLSLSIYISLESTPHSPTGVEHSLVVVVIQR